MTPGLGSAGQAGSIRFASGVIFQATYSHRLGAVPRAELYFELPFIAAPNIGVSSIKSGVPSDYASLFVTPGIRLRLVPRAPISPWLSVGGGYARFHESARLQDGSPNRGRIGSNRGAVQWGGGLDFRTPIKVLFPVGLRIEARDVYSGRPNYNLPTGGGFQHNVLFSGGLVMSF